MIDPITAYILDAIEELKQKDKTREIALAITNLQQALMWYREAQEIAMDAST